MPRTNRVSEIRKPFRIWLIAILVIGTLWAARVAHGQSPYESKKYGELATPKQKTDTVCAQFLERGKEVADSVEYFLRIDGKETKRWIPKLKEKKSIIWNEWYNFFYSGSELDSIKIVLFHKRCPLKQNA